LTFSLFWNAFSSLPQLSSRRALSRDSTASPSAFSIAVEEHLDLVTDLDIAFAAAVRRIRAAPPAFVFSRRR